MNVILEQINSAGLRFVEFALPMLVQSSVLILILLLTDFALRKKVRAVFRYWIWLLVLIKLVLPTSLSSPVSLGYFFGDQLAYVDRTETTAETAQTAPAIVTPMIAPPRIEAGSDTSAIVPTTPTIEPAVAKPVNTQVVSVTPLSWQGVVFLLWLTVVIAMGLLLLQRAIFVRGLVAQAKEANGFMDDMLESCRKSMVVKRKIRLKVSPNAASPAVCGLFRPVILVPKNLTSNLSASQLQAVLLHELAHIRRGDLWINLAQTLLQIIYFYNPLLWVANCIIRRVREQAVDEMVLVAMGEKARQYPQTLVNVAKMAFKRPALSLRLIGVVESKSALAGRIKHILNRPMPKRAKLGILGLAVVIIIAAILLPMATCKPGPPSLVIKGIVKDAQTGEPIAGARVFDDGYGPKPNWEQIRANERSEWGAITNSAGEYSFLTWPEHHSIKVEVPGYKAKRESLYDGHFVFNKKDEETFDFALEPEKASDSSEFKTKLPNGVTVELVGICEYPSEGKQWWQPDGTWLQLAPYDKIGLKVYTSGKRQAYEFAVRLHNLPQDSNNTKMTKLKINGRSAGGGSKPRKDGKRLPDVRWMAKAFPKDQQTCTVQVGISAGAWNTVATHLGKGCQHIGLPGSNSVHFSEPMTVQNEVKMVVTDTFLDHPHRVIAVDIAGKIYKPAGRGSGTIENIRQTTFGFDRLPVNQIKDFRFQTRPYQWVTFKNVSLRPGVKTDVQVEDTKIEPGSSGEAVDSNKLTGRVVDENGNTVADAQVALSTEKIGVLVANGKLQPIRSGVESRIVQTDSQGMFDFGQMPVENFDLIVAHEKGFAMVESEEFVASGEIHLQPWGHINGQLAEGRKAAGNKIWMSSLPNPTWFRHKREYRDETKCDESGHFVFDKVPSGWFEVGYLTRSGKNSWSITSRTPVVVKTGQTTKMRLGGEGRPLTGRFVPPEGYDKSIYFGEGSRSLLTVRPKEPRPDNYDRMTKQQQRQWREQWHKTDEYKKYRDDYWHHPDWRQYTFFIEKNGSFRIDDVIAGKYQLTVWIEERNTGQGRPEEIAGYYGTIEVPEIPGGRSDEPLDLGKLELTMHNPLRLGDIAPLFEAKTLDGKDLRLIDYRGKFVLLSFWQPVFHPEKQQLQELYDTYGGNRQLEIIGLGGNDTLEEVKNYVRENAIPWPQIYTGEEFKSGIAKDYGIPGVPEIFLVGPDGRIIAKNLRGEKLKSTFNETLELASKNKTDVQVGDGSNAPISEASKENKKPQEPNEPSYDGRSLTELIAALGDQDFQTRIKAVYHLGYMGPKAKPAVPALVDALDEERLRESVLHSLGNIGVGAEDAIPALIKAIAEYAPACRWMAAESLAKIGKAAVPPLKKAAGSEDIYLRIWCNAALAKQQGSDSPNLRYLAQLMKNADKRTAGEAVRALTMLGPISKPLIPDLIEALKHSVVPKKHIAFVLAQTGKDAGLAVPELTKMLQDADLGTRADAIYALSSIGGPDIAPAVPLLIQALKTNDTPNTVMASRVRYTAATALGSVGPDARPAIPALVIALGDKDEFVRANSAKAIGDIDPTDMQAVPALLEAMKDESGRVRVAAAQTLLKIGPVNKEVILAFIEAANDNWKGVITACETFFSFLGPQHSYVIPDLIEMLKTPNERAQRLAIRALGNMGEAAAPAVPYIIESMKNSRLEGIASGALRKLGPKAKAAVPELIKMLGDKRKRFSAALVLEAIGPQAREAIPALQDCLGDKSRVTFARALLAINPKSEKAIQQLVRVAESAYVTDQWTEQPDAHYLLVKYGHEGNRHLHRLIDALENPNSRIRLSAAAYLGKLGAKANEAAESLGRALKDDDPEVRAEAARAILLISLKPSERKEACNILVDLLDGKDFASHDGLFMAQVRAAEALLSFGPLEEWTVPLLTANVQDGSMHTRVAAIKAFGNIGQGAKEALPYLKRLLKAEDWQIRHSAAQAIEKIDNKTDVQVEVEQGNESSESKNTEDYDKISSDSVVVRVVDTKGRSIPIKDVPYTRIYYRDATTGNPIGWQVDLQIEKTLSDGSLLVNHRDVLVRKFLDMNRETKRNDYTISMCFQPKEGPVFSATTLYPQKATDILSFVVPPRTKVAGVGNVAQDELAGRVVDVDGNPIAGAIISVYPDRGLENHPFKTDSKGAFRISGFGDRWCLYIKVEKDGYATQWLTDFEIGKDFIVTMDQNTVLQGVFVNDSGEQAGRTQITLAKNKLTMQPRRGNSVGPITITHETDDKGSYDFPVEPGLYDVKVASESGLFNRSRVFIGAGQIISLPSTLKPGICFQVKVVDSLTNKPIKEVDLWIDSRTAGRVAMKEGSRRTTDSKGLAVWESLMPGNTRLSIRKKGYCRWWSDACLRGFGTFEPVNNRAAYSWQRNIDSLGFDLIPDMPVVVIKMEEGVKLSGLVLSPDGKPVEKAAVDVTPVERPHTLTGDSRYRMITDENGRFGIKEKYWRGYVPAGKQVLYNLCAHDHEGRWANAVSKPFASKPGDEFEFTLKMTKGGSVSGRVIDSEGKPVPDIEVEAIARDNLDTPYFKPRTLTDENGNFTLGPMREGKYWIQPDTMKGVNIARSPKQEKTEVKVVDGKVTSMGNLLFRTGGPNM